MKQILIFAVLAMLAATVPGQTNSLYAADYTSSSNFVHISTNVSGATNFLYIPTNWCDRIPAEKHERAIKDLAAGGVICKVLGHKWRGGRPEGRIPGTQAYIEFADYHPGITFRTCEICGKCESKKEGDWK